MGNDELSLIIGAILLLFGAIKSRLINSFLKKIVGEKLSSVSTLLLIIFVSLSSYILSSAFLELNIEDSSSPKTKPLTESPISTVKKSEPEIYMEMAEDAVSLISDISKDIKENRKIKDSIQEAKREKRWVYKIGDIATNKHQLLSTYNYLKEIEIPKIFKTPQKTYLMFIDKHWSEQMLRDSLDQFKSMISSDLKQKIEVVDLASYCSKYDNLLLNDRVKIGKRKKKQFVDCYVCD